MTEGQVTSVAKVVLLRTPQEPVTSDPYTTAFNSAQSNLPFETFHVPLLTTTFDNLDQLSDIINLADPQNSHSGVIITSARAVRAWSLASTRARLSTWSALPFFVVGHPTRDALLSLPDGPPSSLILGASESGTGERLAEFIAQYFKDHDKANDTAAVISSTDSPRHRRQDLPLLWLVGDKNSDTIDRVLTDLNGPACKPLRVYATGPRAGFEDELKSLLNRIQDDHHRTDPNRELNVWIGLFSPSGAKIVVPLLRAMQLLPRGQREPQTTSSSRSSRIKIRLATIGSVTTRYLREQEGLDADAEAQTPDATGLHHAITNATKKLTAATAASSEPPSP